MSVSLVSVRPVCIGTDNWPFLGEIDILEQRLIVGYQFKCRLLVHVLAEASSRMVSSVFSENELGGYNKNEGTVSELNEGFRYRKLVPDVKRRSRDDPPSPTGQDPRNERWEA